MSSPTPTRPTGRLAAVFTSMSRRAASGIAARIGVDNAGRHAIDAHRRQFERRRTSAKLSAPLATLITAKSAGPKSAVVSGHQRQRAAGTDVGEARDARHPQLAFHGPAYVFHGHGLEGTGLELRGGDHDVIHRTAGAEQIFNAFVTGDVGRYRPWRRWRLQPR